MGRILSFGLLLFLMGGQALRAVNPQDIEFRARLLKTPHVYHMGEPIEIEYSYSSRAEKKYYGSFTGASPDRVSVTPHVTPMNSVFNPRELWPNRGMSGSILGSSGYVTLLPLTQQLDLCDWYRFRKPGRYSVVVVSKEVSRVKSAKEGGGLEHLTLQSSPLHFEILPADPAWDAEQITEIERKLNTAANIGDRGVALRRLALLDTPASVRLLVKAYLANTAAGVDGIFDTALRESSHAALIIPLLTSALSDPAVKVPQGLPGLLADLETRRQLGVMPVYPSDPAGRKRWTEEWKARFRVRDRYLADANALLKASIGKRSGAERAAAIYQVWWDTTQRTPPGTPPPGNLAQLQSDVLAVAGDLDHARQAQFVIVAWHTMPHEELHALVRKLAMGEIHHRAGYDGLEGLGLLCKGWPEECHAAILQNIVKTGARMNKNVILMMPDVEHPELDSMLEAQLRESALLTDAFQSQRTAAAVLRAGSRNLVPAVGSYLDRLAASGRCEGVTEGELLGYLFRVAPEEGEKRLAAMLEARNGGCGIQALRILHQVQPSENIVPVVTRALNAPSLSVEGMAALYLADNGPASSEKALWRRLEQLWNAWRGRASELQTPTMGVLPDTRNQTAMLEQALASALVHARNWRLSAAEHERLRSDCLTQGCRDAAEGKAFLDL